MILPPTLVPGDAVALVAPAGPIDDRALRTAHDRCRALGFRPVDGAAVLARQAYLAGSDQERAADLQAAIEGEAAAIWALRGGYGTMRTLRHVDLDPLTRRPKAFIGFSDNTAVHLALSSLGVASYHGPHAGYRHFPPATERTFRAVLMEAGAPGVLPLPDGCQPAVVVPGTATGRLVGGNLAMLAATCGTPYQPDGAGAILFLEDVEEPAYRLDRMLLQLRLAGLLDGVAGVALGEFSPPRRERAENRRPTRDLVEEILAPLGVPVLLGLPFGHGRENWTLPVGAIARLRDDPPGLELIEPTTAERMEG